MRTSKCVQSKFVQPETYSTLSHRQLLSYGALGLAGSY